MEFEKIREIVSEQLGIDKEDITTETSIYDDLGADSLDLVELIMAFEQEFDLEIDDDDVENIKTIGDAVRYVKETVN